MLTNEDTKANAHKIGHTAVIPELARDEPPVNLLNDGEPIEMKIDTGFVVESNDPSVRKLLDEITELQASPSTTKRGDEVRQARINDLYLELGRTLADQADEPSDFNARVVERMSEDTGKPIDEVLSNLLPGTFGHVVSTDHESEGVGAAMFFDDAAVRRVHAEAAELSEPRDRAHFDRLAGFKDNNPKDAFGTLKAGITSYLYGPVLLEMSIGMAAGAFKYGAHNYLCVAPRSSVYTDAAIRHILAYVGGEDMDPEAGHDPETGEPLSVSHITAAMNSLHVLRAAQINDSVIDDRPPPMPQGFLQRVNAQMRILAKFVPDPVARYYAGGRRGPGRIL